MAQVRVPSNVSSVTLTTSGVVAPVAGVITCTALEATDLCKDEQWGPSTHSIAGTNFATGASDLIMPRVITSITINGNVYPVSNGKISAVPAADTTLFLSGVSSMAEFQLVTG